MHVGTKVSEQDVGAVIVGIRGCFSRLRDVADVLHRDLGITAAMRAVMETVYDGADVTVPDIAREKRVSRQNIQVIVDGLIAARLLGLAENPAHKRSPLVVLTKRGRTTFREMRRRESGLLKAIAEELSPTAMKATSETLAAIRRRLEEMDTETNPNGEDE
ncbi:unnamed protein product [Laminaria digitata]